MNTMTRMSRFLLISTLAALTLALALPATASTEETEKNWTRWGGPNQDFKVTSGEIAPEWPEGGPLQLWSRELGEGYSAVLFEDDRLYTQYRSSDAEGVICMRSDNGRTIWSYLYDHQPHDDHITQFGVGPRATSLIAGDRIYTIGVAGRMHSFEKENGKLVWSKDLWGPDFGGNLLPHGYASSPIEYGDTVIALIGGEGKSIVAFNKADGGVAWAQHSFQNSYSTPRILDVGGQEQLVTFMANEAVGLDPADGDLLWRYPHANQFGQNINRPTLVDGRYLFLSSLQAGSRGLELIPSEGGETTVNELWSSRKVQFYHVTSVNDGDYVYGSSGARTPAFMAAINVKTGEVPWRKRGFSKANSVSADGKLIVLDEDGKLYLTTATPEALVVHSR